jgi:uncharacterized phiE125 gp8 family phage protein
MMSMQLIVEPASEPLTLDEARLFLRIDTNDDDALLASLIAASRRLVEQATRKCLMAQTWRFGFDQWPARGFVRLPLSPLLTLVSVTVMDGSGNRIQQGLNDYRINALEPVPVVQANATPPVSAAACGGIQIDAQLGYGNTAAQVPQAMRLALLLILDRLYDTRGQGDSSLPAAAQVLLAPFIRRSL